MVEGKLSVIIPFAQEHPQCAFTVQAIYCELRDKCDFEIIVIDNHCRELDAQILAAGQQRDRGGDYLSQLAGPERPWLRYLQYTTKLSHWQAKNLGVSMSEGEFLWFCDAHCIPSPGPLWRMFEHYRSAHEMIHGTMHLPISYMLEQPGRELIYKLVHDVEHGIMHYQFSPYQPSELPYQVPCMSTCGMMMSRKIYDALGGWPVELGIYGGGEHFINFTMAVLGYSINIWPDLPLYHYAAPRGYHWNFQDYHRNRCIASYMFGGEEWATRYAANVKAPDPMKHAIIASVLGSKECKTHRDFVRTRQVQSIEEWLEKVLKKGK